MLTLMLLRLYNAPLPLIEVLKLLVNTFDVFNQLHIAMRLFGDFVVYNLPYWFYVIILVDNSFYLDCFIFPSSSFLSLFHRFNSSINPKLRYWILAPFIFGANPLDQ